MVCTTGPTSRTVIALSAAATSMALLVICRPHAPTPKIPAHASGSAHTHSVMGTPAGRLARTSSASAGETGSSAGAAAELAVKPPFGLVALAMLVAAVLAVCGDASNCLWGKCGNGRGTGRERAGGMRGNGRGTGEEKGEEKGGERAGNGRGTGEDRARNGREKRASERDGNGNGYGKRASRQCSISEMESRPAWPCTNL